MVGLKRILLRPGASDTKRKICKRRNHERAVRTDETRSRKVIFEVKTGPLLFRITGIVVFLQILLGGLLTFDFIAPTFHIITGLIVFFLAIATMVVTLTSKPVFRPLRGLSISLVALIIIQIILGLETLSSGSSILAWVHFAVAMGIYGMIIAGTFMSMAWNRMEKGQRVQEKSLNEK